METLNSCPICGHEQLAAFLICKDHYVSQEEFHIVSCKACGFKFTNPRPTNVEIGSYYKAENYISHSDSQKGLVNKAYHLVRRYTLVKKLQLILSNKKKPNAISLLDIGCGTGAFLDVCKRAGVNCMGIEPDADARDLAEKKHGLKVGAPESINSITPSSLDVVTMWHVLEHVHELQGTIQKIKELLKPYGRAFVAVPNCTSYDAKHYEKFWAAYDLPRHLYHFSPDDIRRICAQHDLELAQILPMRFDSFYVSMMSEKYMTGNSNYLRAIWIGLKSNFAAIKSGKQFSSQIYIIQKRA